MDELKFKVEIWENGAKNHMFGAVKMTKQG